MMKIALIGASGNAGSRIAAELSSRGHKVTAIARDASRITALPGVTPLALDIADTAALADALKGHDAVVSSVHFLASDAEQLIGAVKASGVRRYLVVGGAGSLEVAPGVKLFDTPQFPPEYKAEATKGGAFLDRLKTESDLDWTFLSPSAVFVPGTRTGTFRLGEDQLLQNENGSSISFEDYAIALVDEIETPRHSRRRFTVGY
ncbi:NAD(P)-dependent oxidoreductase [Aureimonas sp. ME7]|uniref:NAD(P)-dependent oxidoreductase n=1 Tax=Aureimonas sp. ME7 TaxID=2744252 RepID=UPI0015F5BFAD|nr:NAD(P)-dependent oxidoreductase [Aureimonas sp. ME7]